MSEPGLRVELADGVAWVTLDRPDARNALTLALRAALGDAVSTTTGGKPAAAVLLLSDGANTAGSYEPLDAADRAKELGVPV